MSNRLFVYGVETCPTGCSFMGSKYVQPAVRLWGRNMSSRLFVYGVKACPAGCSFRCQNMSSRLFVYGVKTCPAGCSLRCQNMSSRLFVYGDKTWPGGCSCWGQNMSSRLFVYGSKHVQPVVRVRGQTSHVYVSFLPILLPISCSHTSCHISPTHSHNIFPSLQIIMENIQVITTDKAFTVTVGNACCLLN